MSRCLILSSLTLSSGTGIRIMGIANGLLRNGNRVSLVGAGDYDDLATGVNLIYVKASTSPSVTSLRLLFANLKAVLRNCPDYCIASKPLPQSILPAFIARVMGATTLLDFDDLESGYWRGRPWRPLLRLMEIFFPRLFHHTCVHTQEIADEVKRLAGLGPARVLRLDQGVDTSLFTQRQKEVYPTRPVVLYAAHLGVAAEGLQFVLEGFRKLALKNKDAILLVVGSGPLLHQFRKTAQKLKLDERVVFAGNISHHLMPRVMELARVAVNYTSPENPANHCRASVKVREYLAMGLPVATNLVGSDLIPFRPFLQVFDSGNQEGFALAVERGLGQGRNNAASREIMKNWAWEVVVKKFLQELQQRWKQPEAPLGIGG